MAQTPGLALVCVHAAANPLRLLSQVLSQRANVGGVFAGRENNRKINMQVNPLFKVR